MQVMLAVLAELNRRNLDGLGQGGPGFGEMVERHTLGQHADSEQLRRQREADLAASRGDEFHLRYRLWPERLAEIDAWLAPSRRLWAERLDALQVHLGQEQV